MKLRNYGVFGLGVSVVLLLCILAVSFFVTTWFAMLIGGMVGHFIGNEWLMSLGYWQYAPVWIIVWLVKAL